MKVSLAIATPEDAAALLELREAFVREVGYHFGVKRGEGGVWIVPEELRGDGLGIETQMVRADGEAVGFVDLVWPVGDEPGRILALHVDAQHRRLGIGRWVLATALGTESGEWQLLTPLGVVGAVAFIDSVLPGIARDPWLDAGRLPGTTCGLRLSRAWTGSVRRPERPVRPVRSHTILDVPEPELEPIFTTMFGATLGVFVFLGALFKAFGPVSEELRLVYLALAAIWSGFGLYLILRQLPTGILHWELFDRRARQTCVRWLLVIWALWTTAVVLMAFIWHPLAAAFYWAAMFSPGWAYTRVNRQFDATLERAPDAPASLGSG